MQDTSICRQQTQRVALLLFNTVQSDLVSDGALVRS